MKKIFKKEQLRTLNAYPKEVVESITETIQILDENYGADRCINDLGGYVLLAENIVDIEVLKQDILKNIIPEYTDLIGCKEGVNYTSSLFLLSSDYSVVIVTAEEFSKILLQ